MTKILIIEDADSLRNDIVEMLSFEGYEVISAENGIAGVTMAREHKPDLIICDIMMPELDGYGVLNTLRQDDRMMMIPFIFLTAKTDRGDVRHGMGLGADDYLSKPFIASELLESIQTRLEKHKNFNDMAKERINSLSENIITALPHEIHTPLNTIIGFSDMLLTESHRISATQVVEWAKHINLAAQRLYRLVENYLAYVHTEVIAHNPAEMEILSNSILEHPGVIIQFHALLKARQTNRETDLVLQTEEDAAIRIAASDFGKIIEELIDNALKFSEPATPVTVETDIVGNHYVVRITNLGREMTPEQIESIGAHMQFDRHFYEQQGSGMGLAIIKRLLELYKGNFSITNIPGQGITVTIKLLLA